MFRALTTSNTTPTTISGLRVDATWPARGTIAFTRDVDAKRVTLRLRGNRFIGETR